MCSSSVRSNAPVHMLAHEELQLIFSLLPFHERLTLSSVCKTWRHALALPSEAWRDIDISSSALSADIAAGQCPEIQRNRILRWASRHGCAVRALKVAFKPLEDMDSLLQALLPSCVNLVSLDLNGRLLGSLWTLAGFNHLQRLSIELHEPRMGIVCSHVCALTSLRVLELSDQSKGAALALRDNRCGFEALCALTNLRKLWLNLFGVVGHVPCALSRLKNLVVLHLEQCGVVSLPASMSALQRLRKLSLVGNPLDAASGLPNSLAACTALQHIDIGDCELCQLPSQLNLLTSLCGLECDYQSELVIGDSILSLTELRFLVLDWEAVIELPPGACFSLPSLELVVLRCLNVTEGDCLHPGTYAALVEAAQHCELHILVYPGGTAMLPVPFVEQLLELGNRATMHFAAANWREHMHSKWAAKFEEQLDQLVDED